MFSKPTASFLPMQDISAVYLLISNRRILSRKQMVSKMLMPPG